VVAKLSGRLREKAAWLPWDWGASLPDAHAIQAVMDGRADEEQQKRAIRAIVEGVCQTYELSYSPDSELDTVFAEGKRFVGLQLVTLMRLNISTIIRAKENG
jgi:hypothetical protein